MTDPITDPGTPDRPPLMLIAEQRLSPMAFENLREAMAASHRGLTTVLDTGFKVYQLVGGQWVPIDERPAWWRRLWPFARRAAK